MIQVESTPGQVIIRPDFDIVATRVGEIREAVLNVASKGGRVVLDLSQATLIDSMGIGVIIACLKTLKQHGGDLKVETNNPDIVKLFKVLKLDFILASA